MDRKEISRASPNLLKEKQKSSSHPQDISEMSAEADEPDNDISPTPHITSASPDGLRASETPHAPPQGNVEMPPKANKSPSSAAACRSTVMDEHKVEPLKDSQKVSPKRERITRFTNPFKTPKSAGGSPEGKKLSRAVGESIEHKKTPGIFKKHRPAESPGTLSEDNKSSKAGGDSSGTAIDEQEMVILKDPEEASPKHTQKFKQNVKKIVRHLKPKSTPDKLPEDNKSSRAGGDSSGTVIDEQVTKHKQKITQNVKKIVQHLKPKSTPDKLPENSEMSGAAGSSACTAKDKQTLKATGSSEVPRPKDKDKKRRQGKHYKNSAIAGASVAVSLNFEQNLEQNCLAEASQQLLAREARLFIIDDQRSESTDKQRVRTEEEEMILKKDYETLSMRIWLAVSNSFDRRNQYALESAVTAILQEEEQDQHWKEAAEKECPSWRPMGYQDMHDIVIQSMVKKRIQQVEEEEQAEDKLKKEISQMNLLIQDDMLQVVRDVQACYPPEFGICNMYAQLYHQAFSTKLRQLPRYNIPIEECIFILKQISNYSNKVLHQEELESYLSSEALEPLLPAEDLKSLEEQYLSHKENEVKTWLFNILRLEEESWKTNTKPELNDGYFCNFAQDVIYLVDGAMKEAINLLSNRNKAQRILYLLPSFLESYKKSMEDLLKNQENITEILKAHLFGIKNLREYIADRDNLPDDMKTEWLSTAADIRDSCHKYFLSPIHDVLKVNYSKLWTPDWFSEHHEFIEELEDKLNKLMHPLKDLDSVCLQELLSQLHFEVMIEYVRRMLKRKLKLKNKDEQETAAAMLCEDSDRINTLFIENGSDKTWLCEILPKVAEVLKVQDSDTLELEICALLKNYPDLTERQIRSILQLKTNISCADNRMIKECYQQSKSNIPDSEPAQLFFCRVPHSFSLNLYSCFCMWPTFKGTHPCKNGCQASSPV